MLPSGDKKDDAERLIANAKQSMKEAEARLAKKLGVSLCERCWPPEIMTCSDSGDFICRNCGKQGMIIS